MIGANASGKSNALEALQVLKWLLNPLFQQNLENINALHLRDARRVLFNGDIKKSDFGWNFVNENQGFTSSSSEFITHYPNKEYGEFENTCLTILQSSMILDMHPPEMRTYSL